MQTSLQVLGLMAALDLICDALMYGQAHRGSMILLDLLAHSSLGHVAFRSLAPEGRPEVDNIFKPLPTVFELPPTTAKQSWRQHSGPRKPCWQKPCRQIYARGLHRYAGAKLPTRFLFSQSMRRYTNSIIVILNQVTLNIVNQTIIVSIHNSITSSDITVLLYVILYE